MEGARHWGAEDSPGLRDHAVPHHNAARAGSCLADSGPECMMCVCAVETVFVFFSKQLDCQL